MVNNFSRDSIHSDINDQEREDLLKLHKGQATDLINGKDTEAFVVVVIKKGENHCAGTMVAHHDIEKGFLIVEIMEEYVQRFGASIKKIVEGFKK